MYNSTNRRHTDGHAWAGDARPRAVLSAPHTALAAVGASNARGRRGARIAHHLSNKYHDLVEHHIQRALSCRPSERCCFFQTEHRSEAWQFDLPPRPAAQTRQMVPQTRVGAANANWIVKALRRVAEVNLSGKALRRVATIADAIAPWTLEINTSDRAPRSERISGRCARRPNVCDGVWEVVGNAFADDVVCWVRERRVIDRDVALQVDPHAEMKKALDSADAATVHQKAVPDSEEILNLADCRRGDVESHSPFRQMVLQECIRVDDADNGTVWTGSGLRAGSVRRFKVEKSAWCVRVASAP